MASCTYLQLLDTGARVIGEALSVRNLDVLTIQNPSQVIPHLSANRKQRVGMLAATGSARSDSVLGKRLKWGRQFSLPTRERSGFYLHYKPERPVGPWRSPRPIPHLTHKIEEVRQGRGLLKLTRTFLEESRRASKTLDFHAGGSPEQ